jgi:hypothetical protein
MFSPPAVQQCPCYSKFSLALFEPLPYCRLCNRGATGTVPRRSTPKFPFCYNPFGIQENSGQATSPPASAASAMDQSMDLSECDPLFPDATFAKPPSQGTKRNEYFHEIMDPDLQYQDKKLKRDDGIAFPFHSFQWHPGKNN